MLFDCLSLLNNNGSNNNDNTIIICKDVALDTSQENKQNAIKINVCIQKPFKKSFTVVRTLIQP